IKPELILYERIIKELDVKPEDSIYIDDKEKYLKPAINLGMRTILFKSAEQLKTVLPGELDSPHWSGEK
ncbi:MAG: HAD-IA family hydrolase, partial [Alcanivorax sp.]|nr:HAD-IA family hydrolase [Alcanivorax sp.]